MSKKFSEKWKEERDAKRAAKAEKQGETPAQLEKGDTLDQAMQGQVKINLNKFNGKHLFVATPAYGGMVGEAYLKSMVRLGILFKTHNLNFTLATIANESLITRGRNTLVSMFMSNPAYTEMIFIDADIHFEAESVIKLWDKVCDSQYGIDVAVGSYPKKSINWENVIKRTNQLGDNATPEEITKHQASYVLNVRADEKGRIPLKNGMLPVYDGGTGFMLFSRSVIQNMMDKMPELHYKNDLNTDPKHDPYCYALFDTMIDPDTNRYLSEDYTFCRRYQDMGGTIWLDPSINLDHQGSYVFKGNISNQFHFDSHATDEEVKNMEKMVNKGKDFAPTPNEVKNSE
jgi:hypothetical protein